MVFKRECRLAGECKYAVFQVFLSNYRLISQGKGLFWIELFRRISHIFSIIYKVTYIDKNKAVRILSLFCLDCYTWPFYRFPVKQFIYRFSQA